VVKADALVLAPAVLQIQVLSARKLRRMDKLKQNDVFCAISVSHACDIVACTVR
jgi:hypothetical protein